KAHDVLVLAVREHHRLERARQIGCDVRRNRALDLPGPARRRLLAALLDGRTPVRIELIDEVLAWSRLEVIRRTVGIVRTTRPGRDLRWPERIPPRGGCFTARHDRRPPGNRCRQRPRRAPRAAPPETVRSEGQGRERQDCFVPPLQMIEYSHAPSALCACSPYPVDF